MTGYKETLHHYLRVAREAMLWKLDGLGEYDVRRPLTPTGTNLLGLVKHLALVEAGYFGVTFGRPVADQLPGWGDDDEPDTDMWAAPGESRELVVEFYRRVWRHADETIEALELDATGRVPWWPPADGEVSLHQILVHVTAETHRHAGHADIVRELIDGAAGMRRDVGNLPDGDAAWWSGRRERLQSVAEAFRAG
jgi:hypothetical protein